MKAQTSKDQVERLAKLWGDSPEPIQRAVIADLRALHAEAEREVEIERAASDYGLFSAVDGSYWWIDRNAGRPTIMTAAITNYPTRRECDDSILAAVNAYEQKESGSNG